MHSPGGQSSHALTRRSELTCTHQEVRVVEVQEVVHVVQDGQPELRERGKEGERRKVLEEHL